MLVVDLNDMCSNLSVFVDNVATKLTIVCVCAAEVNQTYEWLINDQSGRDMEPLLYSKVITHLIVLDVRKLKRTVI